MTYSAEIDVNGKWYWVELRYNIVGRYIPATRIDPEEWPEVEWEIENLKSSDDDGNEYDVTDEAEIQSVIDFLIKDGIDGTLLECAADYEENRRAEEKWERMRDER